MWRGADIPLLMRGRRNCGRVRLISRSGAHDADFGLELFVVCIPKDLFYMHGSGRKIERVVRHGISGKPIFPVDLLAVGVKARKEVFTMLGM